MGSYYRSRMLADIEMINRQSLYRDTFPDPPVPPCRPLSAFFSRRASDPSVRDTCVDQISPICEGLYLTSLGGVEFRDIRRLGVTMVINATSELPTYSRVGIDTVRISITDSAYEDIYVHFDKVADLIQREISNGGTVIVYCIAGISRSAALVMAYLMKYKLMSLRTAFSHVRARRSMIHPNNGFFRQLVDYERRLNGVPTVTMVWNDTAHEFIPDVYEYEYNNTILLLRKYGIPATRYP